MADEAEGRAATAWPMGFLFPFATAARATPGRGDRAGRTLAVCSVKGGVGKTTTAVNLAAALSLQKGARVLLLDADPQGHASGCLSGIAQGDGGGLADVLAQRGADLSEVVLETDRPGLHLLPSGTRLQSAEQNIATRIGRETVIRGLLDVPRSRYDYVVIDCPPSLSLLAVGALVAADSVLVPCEPSPLAICGLGSLIEGLADVRERLNSSLSLLGVLQTRVDARNKHQNAEAEEALRATVGEHLLPVSISVSTALARARTTGIPTVFAQPGTRAAEQYVALAKIVRKRLGATVAEGVTSAEAAG
jgi:chromosome partitioning protein